MLSEMSNPSIILESQRGPSSENAKLGATYSAGMGLGCALAALAFASLGQQAAHADTAFQEIGLTQLQTVVPQLDGAGVSVGQVEANPAPGGPYVYFESNSNLNPGASFTYVDALGASSGSYNPNLGS